MDEDTNERIEAPVEWVRLLCDHEDRIESVRMVWRRANLPYRAIVPEHIDIRWLGDDDWDKHEREDTHFMWDLRDIKDRDQRVAAIEALAGDLWSIARRWTELRGTWCDFRLYGFCGEEELFCRGRRCRPAVDAAAQEGSASETPEPGAGLSEVQAAHVRYLEDRINLAQSERNDAFERSDKMLHNNHLLWSQLADAMREATDFQRQQVETAKEMRSGMVELRAGAFRELQETARVQSISNVVKHGIDAFLSQLVPLADRAIEAFGGDRVVSAEVFPKFERAQQAMRYLALTLTDTQLLTLFKNDKEAGTQFRGELDKAARAEAEIEALALISGLSNVFRSTRLRDVADPEQQLCLRFIIGRLAMFDIATDGPSQAKA